MKLIKPFYQIEHCPDNLNAIMEAGATCYKSEPKDVNKFVGMLIRKGHLSVLEHEYIRVRFIVDRGVGYELIRHRLCSFSQESTRYCNYKDGVTFIIPPWFDTKELEDNDDGQFHNTDIWLNHMLNCEKAYLALLAQGETPQQARSVLPNSLKTEIVVTANLREWMHIFKLRCSKMSHPQMRQVMIPLRDELNKKLPVIFETNTL